MAIILKFSGSFLLSPSHVSARLPILPRALLLQRTLISSPVKYHSSASPNSCWITRRRSGRTIERRDFLVTSFCTAPETSTSNPTTIQGEGDDENENKIKESADLLDLRVGRILKAWKHEEGDFLYVEEVDIGEPHPRLICSGLVNFIPLDHLQDKKVVVLANLKPRNMRGVKSCGMLMAASDASHQSVELLEPPADSLPGKRIWFGSEHDKENQPPAATANQIQKKKIWELVQRHLRTDSSCVAMLGVHVMRTSAGFVTCKSLRNANIS